MTEKELPLTSSQKLQPDVVTAAALYAKSIPNGTEPPWLSAVREVLGDGTTLFPFDHLLKHARNTLGLFSRDEYR